MQFDPINKTLYTDSGEFVKKLICHFDIKWDALNSVNSKIRNCTICKHNIIDTDFLKDAEILSIISENPNTCFKVGLNQKNIKVISHGKRVKK